MGVKVELLGFEVEFWELRLSFWVLRLFLSYLHAHAYPIVPLYPHALAQCIHVQNSYLATYAQSTYNVNLQSPYVCGLAG